MAPTIQPDEGLAPILVSVKQAAQMLGISTWSCYQLLDDNEKRKAPIESRYIGRRRLVVLESLKKYAAELPTEPQGETA